MSLILFQGSSEVLTLRYSSSIGNVRNIGLAHALHLTSESYEWASAAFYFGTIFFGTIGGLMLKVVRPSLWLAICMIGWGTMASLQAATYNAGGIIAVRLFLGIFEASFAPGCALYMSFWYLKSELSLRIAAYAGTSALSGILGGIISYGLAKTEKHLAVPAWKAVFLVEGIPTIAFGFAILFILPDRPELASARWFTERERAILIARRSRSSPKEDTAINLAQVKS